MTMKAVLTQAQAIQVGVHETSWQAVIRMAARPLIEGEFIRPAYCQSVIDNTLEYGAYYVMGEGVAIPHARPECGVMKNGFSLVLLDTPVIFPGGEAADIVMMFAATDSNSHLQEGISTITGWLDDEDMMMKLRGAGTVEEVIALL